MARTQAKGTQLQDNSVNLDNPNQDVAGVLPVANGGTGAAAQTLNNVLLGNGTGALQNVAPGASGNVLQSNGTTWQSAAPAGGGGSPVNTTKGDIAGFSTVAARIPVGLDGQVLVADSGQALGLSYQNVGLLTRRNAQINSNPGLLTLSQSGFAAAPTITAAALTTQGDDTDGPFIQLNTAATAASISSVATLFTQFRREWGTEIAFRIKTTAVALTSPRIWIGLFSASPAAADQPLVHIAGFRFVSAGAQGSPNWQGITAESPPARSMRPLPPC